MKILLLLSLLSIYVISTAQTKLIDSSNATPKTQIEEFALKKGTILKKEFKSFGFFKDCQVQSLKITDMSSNKEISGIKFTKATGTMYVTRSADAYLDQDELDDVINFFKKVETLPTDFDNYTEYNLITKDGFKAFAYADPHKDWFYGFQIDQYNSDSQVYAKKKDIDNLIAELETVKINL